MKKILSIIGSLGIVAIVPIATISCSSKNNSNGFEYKDIESLLDKDASDVITGTFISIDSSDEPYEENWADIWKEINEEDGTETTEFGLFLSANISEVNESKSEDGNLNDISMFDVEIHAILNHMKSTATDSDFTNTKINLSNKERNAFIALEKEGTLDHKALSEHHEHYSYTIKYKDYSWFRDVVEKD